MISLNDITLTFPDGDERITAVDNVTLTAHPGTVTGITGAQAAQAASVAKLVTARAGAKRTADATLAEDLANVLEELDLRDVTLRKALESEVADLGERLETRKAVEKAVWGMLPKNRLGRQMLKKLKVYSGPEHPHTAQQPTPYTITQVAQ